MSDVLDGVVTPATNEVPPAATPENVAPAPDSTAEQKPDETKPEAKPERTFTQKELDEIVQRRLAKEAKRAAREAAMEVENRFLREQAQARQQPQPQGDGRPRKEDFQDYESYTEAIADWKAEQKATEKFEAFQRQLAEQSERQRMQAQAAEVQTRLMKGAEKYPDFHERVFDDSVPIDKPTAAAIAESEHSADISYHLATHREEAERIARLSPVKQVQEIAALEAKFRTPAPKTTNAPAPIAPVGPGASYKKSLETMTQQEFEAELAKLKR